MEVDDQPVWVVELRHLPAGGPAEAEDPGHRRLEVAAFDDLRERAEPGGKAPGPVVRGVAVEVVAARALEDDAGKGVALDVDGQVARIFGEGRLGRPDLEVRDAAVARRVRVRLRELEDDA